MSALLRPSALRRTVWLALLAMLALALLPTVSHALAAARGDAGWAPVCTPQGLRIVAPADRADGDAPAPLSRASLPEHCPFCAHAAGSLGLPPALGMPALPAEGRAAPNRALPAPRPSLSWHAAQPRAPPHAA